MARYFIEQLVQPGADRLQLGNEAADFIKNALRLCKGDQLTICDGSGLDLSCQIRQLNQNMVELTIISRAENNTEPYYEVHLFQGLLKGEKMSDVIRRSVELGVHRIVPVLSQHSIVHINEKNQTRKNERWSRVAIAAASQARRGKLPQILPAMSLTDCLLQSAFTDLSLFVTDLAKAASIRSRLVAFQQHEKGWQKPVLGLFCGPEAGWAEQELQAAAAAGCQLVNLGRRVLQADSAAAAALVRVVK